MDIFVDHRFDDLIEHRRFHLRVHFGRIDLAEHAADVEIVFFLRVLYRRINHRPGMLDGLVAVGSRGKNIQRMAEYRPAVFMRLVHRRLGDVRF